MEKIFSMTEKELHLYNVMTEFETKGVTQVRTAELLGVSERHFRRLLKAYREHGLDGIVSKRKGKPSNRRMKDEVRERIEEKLMTSYLNCGPTFAWEKLLKVEKINVSIETVRKIMIELGLWESRKRKRLKLHQRRNRREREGELIQIDGSQHAWFEERGSKCCLLGFIDDATSKVKHLKFVPVEDGKGYFSNLKEYMLKHGKPLAYYTDRLNVFRVNNDKEGYRKKGLTQVGRALKEIGVELICANSPQAKGRVERLFGTLQDRLVNELRLNGINDIDAGNRYLEKYIEEHNELFAVEAEKKEDAHRPVEAKVLDQVLCYKQERKVTNNLEVSYEGRIFQIKDKGSGYALRKATISVRESLEGEISLEYQERILEYKELLVKDKQGKVANKKEILLRGVA